MRDKSSIIGRFLLTFAVLGIAGIGATIFVLINQRIRLPNQSVYTVYARFTAADGVIGGIGQPVTVLGVKVGQVTNVALDDGVANVKLEIRKDDLPEIQANATAALSPVTPLKDMEVHLNPGRPPAPVLAPGGTIGTGRTTTPVPLSDLLSRLDADTRDYLSVVIATLDRGTRGRAPDLRRLLLQFGPTTEQAGQISAALADRRTKLAEFVHNLARLTRAASRDGELQTVVAAGQQTLNAIATQEAALRSTIAQVPSTLDAVRGTLARLPSFARALRPTVDALLPPLQRLPKTLVDTGRFARRGSQVLRSDLRPFVRSARPVVRNAGAIVPDLQRSGVPLTGVAQTLNYLLNELSFVPGGDDQGYLYWAAWFAHNLNSDASTGDANGAILRASVAVGCSPLQQQPKIARLLAPLDVC